MSRRLRRSKNALILPATPQAAFEIPLYHPLMMIIGHGVDMVEIQRVGRLLELHGQRFLDRCYTAGEQSYAAANRKRQIEHLAGRFAAKEAMLKALGTGWRDGIAWTDVEVIRLSTGQPSVALHGLCDQIARQRGITAWSLSISHTASHAIASAIATGKG